MTIFSSHNGSEADLFNSAAHGLDLMLGLCREEAAAGNPLTTPQITAQIDGFLAEMAKLGRERLGFPNPEGDIYPYAVMMCATAIQRLITPISEQEETQ